MRRQALLVEFAGLPGAGKTTLARHVARLLREQGYLAEEPLRAFTGRFWGRGTPHVLKYLRSHPGAAWRALRAIRRTRQQTLRDAMKVSHHWLFLHALMDECRHSDCVGVFDQGIVQALWSIALKAEDGALARFLSSVRPRVCLPDMVILVEVRPDTAAQRLGARPYGGSRLERGPWNPALFARGLAIWEELKPLISSLGRERGGVDVTVVPNDRPELMEENVRQLAAWIRGGARTTGAGLPQCGAAPDVSPAG